MRKVGMNYKAAHLEKNQNSWVGPYIKTKENIDF